MRVFIVLLFLLSFGVLTGCEGPDLSYWDGRATKTECAEIRGAIRAVTLSPVTGCYRAGNPNIILVTTKDDKGYQARKIKGKWHFKESAVIIQR